MQKGKKKIWKGGVHKFPLRIDGTTFDAIKKATETPGHDDYTLSINQAIAKTLADKYKIKSK